MKLTGGQIVAKALKAYGVQYVAGIPGPGCWALMDALLEPGGEIPFIQVMREQSAVHMADGYFRACGRPMAALASLGAAAANTLAGLATARADSSAAVLITGSAATRTAGHGALAEFDRFRSNDFCRTFEGVAKQHWAARRVDELPAILHRAFSTMLGGRPGPVHLDVPMDLQTQSADVTIPPLHEPLPGGRQRADSQRVEKAVALLLAASRPVIVAGGGAIGADASEALTTLAETIGAAVVTTSNGKGAIAEDHRLNAWSIGRTGTTCGNAVAAAADVVLAVGCRLADWPAPDSREGTRFASAPPRLIQLDIDAQEVGRRYPVEVGLVADARSALEDMLAAISDAQSKRALARRDAWFDAIARLKDEWETLLAPRRDADDLPFTSQRPLGELRRIMARDGIIVAGTGNTQAAVKQSFPVYLPRTHLSSAGLATMGWAVPAAIGAKLAMPTREVVCVVGDGDFLQSLQEMAVCVMHGIPVVFVVQNNSGYMSTRNAQQTLMGRHLGSEFNLPDGKLYSPNFAEIARHFGLEAWRVEHGSQLAAALRKAFDSEGPALVEVITARDEAGPFTAGWSGFPIPDYRTAALRDAPRKSRAL